MPRPTLWKLKKSKDLLPLYLLAGDEEFLARDAVDCIRNLWCTGDDTPWVSRDIGPKDDALDILEECASPGLFATRQAVHLRLSHAQCSGLKERLEAWWTSPPPGVLLVLEVTDWHFQKRNTLNLALVKKVLEPAGAALDCRRLWTSPPPWKDRADPWDNELCDWIRERAKGLWRLKIGPRELWELSLRTGNDPGRLAGELEKLSLYLGESTLVTMEALDAVTADRASAEFAPLMEAFQKLRMKDFLTHLHAADAFGLSFGDGDTLSKPEESANVLLSQMQETTRKLLRIQRIVQRHGGEGSPLPHIMKALPEVREKEAKTLAATALKITPETLHSWHGNILAARRRIREGSPAAHSVFYLTMELFHKKITRTKAKA
ncbi:MAG: DNA polymerase III subunit delta [Planctomycetota bacterium]